MAKGRQYAEELVGPLDRSYYETQRNVATKTSETNWEDLQNQYKNLQNKLKAQQEQANRDFANGLVQVAENSMNRMNNANEAMARSGLTQSGLNNLMQQSDTTKKGEEVLRLLGKSGDIAVNIANQLGATNTNMAKKQANLADDLADTLGEIGARDINAQMDYNSGLANLGEAMEAREAQNELEAARRAASGSSGSGSKEYEEKYDKLLERMAIAELLNSEDLSDHDKAGVLSTLYGKNNGLDIVDTYKINSGQSSREQDRLKKLTESQRKEFEGITNTANASEARSNYYKLEERVNNGTATKDEKALYDYFNGNGDMNFGDAKTAYSNLYLDSVGNNNMFKSGRDLNREQFEALMYLYNPSYADGGYAKNLAKYNELQNQEITYEDLARLLYGDK